MLQALFLPPDSPTQLQTVQFPYLDTWKLFKECGDGGVGGYSPGQCILHSQSNVDILNNVRREVSRNFRDKKKAYLRAKIEELETNS